jgi:di/tricarboxylate transporter
MRPFGLLAVAPIGLALLGAGIAYFVLGGTRLLPAHGEGAAGARDRGQHLRSTYGIDASIFEVNVPPGSTLAGLTVGEVEAALGHRLTIVAIQSPAGVRVGPGRDLHVAAGTALALLGPEQAVTEGCRAHGLVRSPALAVFAEELSPSDAGIAELVVPPGSALAGQTLDALRMRQTRGLAVLAVLRCGEVVREGLRVVALQPGDTLVVHGAWADLAAVERERRDFVVLDAGHPRPEVRPHKLLPGLGFFLGALSLILLADVRPSIAMIAGAVGVIVAGVLTIDEAYQAVSWKTVFLLAALIPLGQAVESTGTADWIAGRTLALLGDGVGHAGFQAAVAVLATLFTLLMSNVGATVLLVPLAVSLAARIGADPAVFALTVAISTSNAFVLPTHQVSALIMGPGGYRVADFMRAGGILTVLFWIVSLTMLGLVF